MIKKKKRKKEKEEKVVIVILKKGKIEGVSGEKWLKIEEKWWLMVIVKGERLRGKGWRSNKNKAFVCGERREVFFFFEIFPYKNPNFADIWRRNFPVIFTTNHHFFPFFAFFSLFFPKIWHLITTFPFILTKNPHFLLTSHPFSSYPFLRPIQSNPIKSPSPSPSRIKKRFPMIHRKS